MEILKLNKQKCNEPKFDELDEMISGLETFLDEDPDFNDFLWYKNLSEILDFQDPDGSFKLFEAYDIPSDARVDFCYWPTYLCTAILIKAFLTDSKSFTPKAKLGLLKGLEASCAKNLRGHGYEAFKGQIDALNIFIKSGLNEFIDLYPGLCPQFSEMINKITSQFEEKLSNEDFLGPWGESYEADIKAINEYFCQRQVFVYGTLLSGEANHHYLKNSTCLGNAYIEGYDLYDVGYYPAIVAGDGLVIGELYRVSKEDLPSIDRLEGEGTLYAKRCERVILNGNATFAFTYIYLRDVTGLERIPAWKDDYVWYVSYGSNLLRERFLCYIKGGSFEGSRYRQPCEDETLPLAVKTVEIPFDMYFGNYSASWQNGGVSFLDTTCEGHALGVAYLITRDQFRHVAAQENGGRCPHEGYGWYENIISLGRLNGFEVKTITNDNLRDYNEPCEAYWDTLLRGIKENWPEKSESEIEAYLLHCIRG